MTPPTLQNIKSGLLSTHENCNRICNERKICNKNQGVDWKMANTISRMKIWA
ncbi:hypothetical protein Pint_23059 [Pistacia integerrima]|uniref:Uncharacterized protein n=1 Tax=Pistacia integerrima TaxID=434235 RepID=A0ACC0YJP9_9ROSI|nr:hypothetical protein Pint_23059 [Pistacia integerrima]